MRSASAPISPEMRSTSRSEQFTAPGTIRRGAVLRREWMGLDGLGVAGMIIDS